MEKVRFITKYGIKDYDSTVSKIQLSFFLLGCNVT